ncbi:hypothetical protein GCK72_008019 [Caenorhabditis remanei]|uniref:F-box associated domain-containing protein n=1 Tax=Caenorhabditis remanei TaxID=31234 RepID=A0A6A5HJK3_CAERE|nr:hypothetical protein GCK72_008019 [Caenorhabditis remanei]KAF1768058.1 hypothetical protein GCK72_008019 [Caenorhabditis remanei]
MPNGLTYPGLRCVLEYLEAARRLHITARSPSLKRIDKSIPLRFEKLDIGNWYPIVNDLTIDFFKNEIISFYLSKSPEKKHKQRTPVKSEKALDMWLHYYFGSKSIMHVNKMAFSCCLRNFTLSENLNLKVNELDTQHSSFDEFLPFIDPQSFPLRRLTTKVRGPEFFDHPVLLSADHLLIIITPLCRVKELTELQRIQRKNLWFKLSPLHTANVNQLILNWVENGKEVGTKFVLMDMHGPLGLQLWDSRITEFLDELKEINTRFLPRLPRFSIPINQRSKILCYGIKTEHDGKSVQQLIIEVVDSTTPE